MLIGWDIRDFREERDREGRDRRDKREERMPVGRLSRLGRGRRDPSPPSCPGKCAPRFGRAARPFTAVVGNAAGGPSVCSAKMPVKSCAVVCFKSHRKLQKMLRMRW